jgi:site-specific DNA-methyltransferase (adenine-specific)
MSATGQCIEGDATSLEVWSRLFDGRPFDLLLTDPPYCILTRRRSGGDQRDPKNKKIERGPLKRFETVRDFGAFTNSWMQHAARFAKPHAPFIVWTNLLGRTPTSTAAAAAGRPHLWGEYIWGKRTREGNSGEEILRVVETALIFGTTPLPQPTTHDTAKPWAVVASYDPDGEAERWGKHPSHKPFNVLEPLIRAWSTPQALIADAFSGSGSIAAAAKKLERACAAIELEPVWAQTTNERLRAQ